MNLPTAKQIVFFIIFLLPLSELSAQNGMKGTWNLREKDSLLKYAEKTEYYKGIIWDYSSAMHELIPESPDTYQYIRTSKYKKTRCTYKSSNAEELVIQIFADFSNYNNSTANCQTKDLSSYNRFITVGKDKDKMVGYHLTEDENYQSYTTKVYVNLYGPDEIGETIHRDSLSPLAQLNEAELFYSLNNGSVYLSDKNNLNKIKGLSSDQIEWNENVYYNVLIGKNYFYLQLEQTKDEFKIVRIDPKTGEMATVVADAYAPRFYNDHLYYMADDGLIKMNPESNETSQILTHEQVDALSIKSNYTFLDEQMIWGNELIFLAHVDFLQSLQFSELNQVKERLSELQNQLDDLGFEEYDLLDPVAEEGADNGPTIKFSDLPENEQKIINEIKILREKRIEIQKKLGEQMKAGNLAGKAKKGVMPEEYKLMQHPVTRKPIFVTDQIGWPIYTWRNIMILPPVNER
jgi:hypothetical protein